MRTISVSASHVMLQSSSPAVTSIDPEPSPFIIVLTLYERISGVAKAVATSKIGRKNFIDKKVYLFRQSKNGLGDTLKWIQQYHLPALGKYCQDSNSGLNIYDISIYPKETNFAAKFRCLNMIGSIYYILHHHLRHHCNRSFFA